MLHKLFLFYRLRVLFKSSRLFLFDDQTARPSHRWQVLPSEFSQLFSITLKICRKNQIKSAHFHGVWSKNLSNTVQSRKQQCNNVTAKSVRTVLIRKCFNASLRAQQWYVLFALRRNQKDHGLSIPSPAHSSKGQKSFCLRTAGRSRAASGGDSP